MKNPDNSVCPSICLPICLSVKRVHCDKTEEISLQIFTLYQRSFSLVFWEEEWLVGAAPSTWNFRSTGHHWSEIANFQTIFARSTSAVTPSKKVQLTLIGSPLYSHFPMSLRWSSYVAPKPSKVGLKNAKWLISVAWRKSATKFLCVNTVSNKVVRHSLA